MTVCRPDIIRCRSCGRPLRAEKSVTARLGPVCRVHHPRRRHPRAA